MRLSLFIISILLSLSAFNQLNSVVYLKNGSAVRGEVLQNDSTVVRLRTRDGSYWNFNPAEVESIQKYEAEIPARGFYNRTSIGILSGESFDASLRVVNGFALNRHWELGLGLGLESMRWDGYIPVFLEARYAVFKGSTRPYLGVHAGYEMPVRNMQFDKGGFSGGVEFGVTNYFSRHIGISTSIGYRYSYMVQKNSWWDDFVTTTQMNRFEIRLGFVFR